MDAWKIFYANPNMEYLPIFGDAKAAEFICSKIVENIA
jgi:hypothetical protein